MIKTMDLSVGRHLGIEEPIYHALPYIGSTSIKSAANNLASLLIPIEETPRMLLGKLVHKFILEGDDAFSKSYVIEPEWGLNKNSYAYKEKRAEFEIVSSGKRIVPALFDKTPTMDILNGIRNSINNHPWGISLMRSGKEEFTLIAHDPKTNEMLKARLDWFPEKLSIVDLKLTADITRFRYQVSSLHYDLQCAHYSMVAEYCGMPIDTFFFIAVESTPPYAIQIGYITEDKMSIAKNEVSRLIGLIHESKEMNWWPNYRLPDHFISLKQITESPRELLEVY